MGKYGQAAVNAVSLIVSGKAADPPDAWKQATIAIFGKGTSSQEKSCPRDAFLGLCESGMVKGVSPGNYTESVDNKAYAVAAAQLLKSNASVRSLGNTALWKKVLNQLKASASKARNQQMDVVKTLFDHRLI